MRYLCSVALKLQLLFLVALALITSLTKKAKHGRLTKALLERQTQQLKIAARGHLEPQCQTPRCLQQQLQYMLRARQYVSIHNSNLRLTPRTTHSHRKFRQYYKYTLGTQPAYSENPD